MILIRIALIFFAFFSTKSFSFEKHLVRTEVIMGYTCKYKELRWYPPYVFDYAKRNFFFNTLQRPPYLPADFREIVCHDTLQYGEPDSPLFPRLEERASFELWDMFCFDCGDRDQNGKIDLNEHISYEYRRRSGNDGVELNPFSILRWEFVPKETLVWGHHKVNLGLLMTPFLNSANEAECPTKDDYKGDNLLYQILGEFIGIDTQGLWLAEGEPQVSTSGDTIVDYLLIRESELKSAWFYFEKGRHMIPDRYTASRKTIHFYYPIDPKRPYIRQGHQLMYTLRSLDEVGRSDDAGPGLRAPDKRIGCIPH